MLNVKIMPSLLSAHMGRLEEACRQSEQAGADGLHIDIMDGHFVPNLSMGPDVVRMARQATKLHLSVHLMVTHPDFFAKPFLDAGADTLHVHVESHCEILPVLKFIRSSGKRAGLVINPETPLQAADRLLDKVDEILFMTVHPGFGGQAFIPNVLSKIEELRRQKRNLDISVDGGINLETAKESAKAGANIFLAGTSLFRAPDLAEAIQHMRKTAEDALKRCVA